jgi:hypothetical protein
MIGTIRSALLAAALATSAPALAVQGDPALAAEVAAAAAQVRAQLPMRADDVTTAVDIRADGTELVYEMVVDDSVARDEFVASQSAAQAANQTNLCTDPAIAAFIRRGGSMRHIYTNSAGDRFETRIARCP